MTTADFQRALEATPEWFVRANCRGVGPARFFPEKHKPSDAAKKICGDCEVTVECGTYGAGERFGVWGGRAPKARAAQRAERADAGVARAPAMPAVPITVRSPRPQPTWTDTTAEQLFARIADRCDHHDTHGVWPPIDDEDIAS